MTPAARPAERLVSLDVTRGLTIVGMIVVNAAAYLHYVAKDPVYPLLMHAEWIGFTLADWVFPAFVVLMGVSIGIAPAQEPGRVAARTLRLVLIGLALSNLYWMIDMQANAFRPFGVLQRLGLAYACAALLYRRLKPRTRLWLAGLALLLYWPLLLVPTPDGLADLHVAGANLEGWIDRTVLGVHVYEKGPLGFDPEGILSTLPTIAQCLVGVSAGERLRGSRPLIAARDLTGAGVVLVVGGMVWAPFFPLIKGVWTSSYVLLSTGLTFVVLGATVVVCDLWRLRGPLTGFLTAFGANAVFAYVLHYLATVVLGWDIAAVLYRAGEPWLEPQAAALIPVAAFLALCWWPLSHMQRRGWIVKV
ncbi:acyltransferase family protein [Caulobacter sp. 17J80-11]|uniref:acyltransferase family protein n=1 Tax=Caulobacter sp. 17J80-11 TaxID=2763502 RepID=UPI001653C1BC|nr:heparan-alpha-glucosaminide N-acetyltransferase domain-containing protein [Caulobacter sp. 17J80-11]MBC6982428.1 DUF1624 domain-containing protein [Caulobacter sp. 17J80-11]